MNSVGYASTGNHAAIQADAADVRASDDISGGARPAGAAVDAPALVPRSAHGVGLGTVCLVDPSGTGQLVRQQGNQNAVACLAYLLCLHAAGLASGIVEGLANVGFGIREGVGYLAGRFVTKIADLPLGFVQGAIFAPLKFSPTPAPLDSPALFRRDFCQTFVAEPHDRLDGTAGNQDGFLSVGGRKQRINAKVYADDRTLRAWLVRNLADDFHLAKVQADLHQTTRDGDLGRNLDAQFRAPTAWQRQEPIAHFRGLIGEDDAAVLRLAEWIAGIGVAIAPKDGRCGDRFAEIGNGLLDRLRMQAGESSLGLFLKVGLAWPRLAGSADSGVKLYQPIPHSGGFQTDSGENAPVALRAW